MRRPSDDSTPWRMTFWMLLFVTAVTKLLLASHLALFVDEAFYWQEGRHLAWTYSDLPPLTAWLIRAGEALFGHSTLAVRSFFIGIALAIPVLVRSISARHFGEQAGLQAGCWTLLLPLLASFGVLALPDIPLTLLCLLAIDALDRLADSPRHWLCSAWLGICLALGWLTHYRIAMLWLAGAIFVLATLRGRRLLFAPSFWMAMAISSVGLLPVLLGDPLIGAESMQFQLLDRHPWSFHADALVQPLEQALVSTPVLYGLLIAALFACLRMMRGTFQPAPWDLVGVVATTFIVGYLLLGLFADSERFRVHWPLPGYLALIIVLPDLVRRWQSRWPQLRWCTRFAAALAIVGTLTVYGYFAAAATPGGASLLSRYKAFPEHFVGWNEAAATTRRLLANPQFRDSVLVADNFMLAAELDFALDGERPVYSLDHPLNLKHGRAPQLRHWRRDEAGLAEISGKRVLLVVEETTGRARERASWLNSLCHRIGELRPLAVIELYDGRKRIAWYSGRVGGDDVWAACRYPPADERSPTP